MKWLGTWSIGLMVAAALVFGSNQAFAGGVDREEYCMEESWHLGFCPPYTTETCNIACSVPYGGGSCEWMDNGFCCICMI